MSATASPGAQQSLLASDTDTILANLNDEQRAAVTHGEGALLIVAGAGTGKTAVITRRIAWLIATKRARPEEILALTFTDKAAAEMETRVDMLVPYGMVGATIATFHAFGDRLVRDHAIELAITSQLKVGTRADMLVFLRERVFELGLSRYLPLGAPDTHLSALLAVFDRARDEDVTPEQYIHFAEGLLAEAGKDDELRDRAEAEREKSRAYAAYQRLLLESGRVDFGSQISLALRLLRERPHLRRRYQDTYRWILVDEFQDTNHVQFELVKLLAGARGNLTVVGDDDQSIYRFRGAKVENLLTFLEVYPQAGTALLRRNYRSGQRVLDLAHRMVKFNDPERLEAKDPLRFDKRLIADREVEGIVDHWAFEGMSDEADAVAGDIEKALAAGESLRCWRGPMPTWIPWRSRSSVAGYAFSARTSAASIGDPRSPCASTSCAWSPIPRTARRPSACSEIPSSRSTRWTSPGSRRTRVGETVGCWRSPRPRRRTPRPASARAAGTASGGSSTCTRGWSRAPPAGRPPRSCSSS